MPGEVVLDVRGISKYYGRTTALAGIDLSARSGEIVCILGPSGSGKTTLLRIIAGLEQPSGGQVFIKQRSQTEVLAKDRDVGFVFQTTEAVFPHLTVFENIAFPLRLKIRKRPGRDIQSEVNRMIELVRLSPFVERYPEKLSGGEQQRIAIARALIYQPSLLLLDEPLSSLDNILKRELIDIILEIKAEMKPTILYVTHDEREALELADQLAILNDGEILQVGTPTEVLTQPATRKSAEIMGGWSIVKASCRRSGRKWLFDAGTLRFEMGAGGREYGSTVEIGIPSSRVQVSCSERRIDNSSTISVSGTVGRVIPWYGEYLLHVRHAEHTLRIQVERIPLGIAVGSEVCLSFAKSAVRIWSV